MVFELVENDLYRAVANKNHGHEIPFYIDPSTGYPTFVSAVGSPHQYSDGYNSKLCEVSYTAGSVVNEQRESFRRRVVTSGSDMDEKVDWDFRGVVDGKIRNLNNRDEIEKKYQIAHRDPDGRLAEPSINSSWMDTADSDFENVCSGLSEKNYEQMLFTFFGPDPNDPRRIVEMTGGHYNYLPHYVDVKFTLFDEDGGYSDRTKRTFIKRIYLQR